MISFFSSFFTQFFLSITSIFESIYFQSVLVIRNKQRKIDQILAANWIKNIELNIDAIFAI